MNFELDAKVRNWLVDEQVSDLIHKVHPAATLPGRYNAVLLHENLTTYLSTSQAENTGDSVFLNSEKPHLLELGLCHSGEAPPLELGLCHSGEAPPPRARTLS